VIIGEALLLIPRPPLPVTFCSFNTPLTLCEPLPCPPTLSSDEPTTTLVWWLKQLLPQPAAKAVVPKPNTRADAAVIAIRVFFIDFPPKLSTHLDFD
jgi:hypothetical protein